MRILCAVNPPEAIRKILACLGMPVRAPPTAPARIKEWGDGADDIPVYSDAYACSNSKCLLIHRLSR